jgi:hypothetical protein
VIVVDLGPPPAKVLSINAERRMHWAQVRRITNAWRDCAFAEAMVQVKRPRTQPPSVVQVTLPLKRGITRYDPANYYPVVKAVVDGLTLARLWPDDSHEWVGVLEPVMVVGGTDASVSIRPR